MYTFCMRFDWGAGRNRAYQCLRTTVVLGEHQAVVDAPAAGERRGSEVAISRHLDTTGDVLSHS